MLRYSVSKVPESRRTRLRRDIIKAHRNPPKPEPEVTKADGPTDSQDVPIVSRNSGAPESQPLMSPAGPLSKISNDQKVLKGGPGQGPKRPEGLEVRGGSMRRAGTPGPVSPGTETEEDSVFSDSRTGYSAFRKKIYNKKPMQSFDGSYAVYNDPNTTWDSRSAHSMYSMYSAAGLGRPAVKDPERISICDQVFLFLGLIAYLFDIGSDIWVAITYYYFNHMWWFALTLLFILVPSFITTILSVILHTTDWYLERKLRKLGGKSDEQEVVQKDCLYLRTFGRIFCQFIWMSPFIRGLESFSYGCMSRSNSHTMETRKKFFYLSLNERADYALVRLFETFLEAAPQLCLQMYLLAIKADLPSSTWIVVAQVISVVSSMLSLSMALVQHQDALRRSINPAAGLDFCGYFVMFLWRLLTLLARVIAFALFAAYFKFWVFIVVIFHWLVMLLWTMLQNTVYCGRAGAELGCGILEYLFRFAVSLISIFAYINLLPDRTRLRYLLFHILVYIENAAMIITWYSLGSTRSRHIWYHVPALLAVLLGYLIGIAFQVLYFVKCHPSKDNEDYHILQWVAWRDLSLLGPPARNTMSAIVEEEKARLEEEIEEDLEREAMLENMQGILGTSQPSLGYVPSIMDASFSGTPRSIGTVPTPVQNPNLPPIGYGPYPDPNIMPVYGPVNNYSPVQMNPNFVPQQNYSPVPLNVNPESSYSPIPMNPNFYPRQAYSPVGIPINPNFHPRQAYSPVPVGLNPNYPVQFTANVQQKSSPVPIDNVAPDPGTIKPTPSNQPAEPAAETPQENEPVPVHVVRRETVPPTGRSEKPRGPEIPTKTEHTILSGDEQPSAKGRRQTKPTYTTPADKTNTQKSVATEKPQVAPKPKVAKRPVPKPRRNPSTSSQDGRTAPTSSREGKPKRVPSTTSQDGRTTRNIPTSSHEVKPTRTLSTSSRDGRATSRDGRATSNVPSRDGKLTQAPSTTSQDGRTTRNVPTSSREGNPTQVPSTTSQDGRATTNAPTSSPEGNPTQVPSATSQDGRATTNVPTSSRKLKPRRTPSASSRDGKPRPNKSISTEV